MTSYQNSPVLVQHASPPHTLASPLALSSIPTFPSESQSDPVRLPDPIYPSSTPVPDEEVIVPAPSMPDTIMSDAPSIGEAEGDTESHGTTQQHTPSETTRQTSSEPQQQRTEEREQLHPPIDRPITTNDAHNDSQPQAEIEQSQSAGAEASLTDTDPATNVAPLTEGQVPAQEPEIPSQEPSVPPPPPEDEPVPVPEWATWTDDLSTPSEEELKQMADIEELNALDTQAVEKKLLVPVDDPDVRPVKKLRLRWVIKNVRGDKHKPNHARVMVSPPIEVDGRYWQIKFYPRGNEALGSRDARYLSVYVRCATKPLESEDQFTSSVCSIYEGTPEADLGDRTTPRQVYEQTGQEAEHPGKTDRPEDGEPAVTQQSNSTDASDTPGVVDTQPTVTETENVSQEPHPVEDWQVPAQMGVIMYNPQEPRACFYASDSHQFNALNNDWGFTRFGSRKWKYLHVRDQGKRAAILQNDTLGIDVYIRTFDDLSQSLWWHASDGELNWNSKMLSGYFPMGTPPLYNSPAVAGLTALLLLVPFRKLIQSIDGGAWRANSQIRPRPLVCKLQMILSLMRHLDPATENYVNVYPAIEELQEHGECFYEVTSFWECLRRSLELEMEGEDLALQELRRIFDTADGPFAIPALPVEHVADIQQSIEKLLDEQKFQGHLPNFLPLSLDRQKFDKRTRQWKLLHDYVHLNEEIDLTRFSDAGHDVKYTLYGFMVHAEERTSEKYFSVLRPGGPNTKWLRFDDGNGNRVFSHTRKGLKDYEGLQGQALKDLTTTRRTAYLAMYIRSDRLQEYLASEMEPYSLPKWLAPHLSSSLVARDDILAEDSLEDSGNEIDVEVYSDEGIQGRDGLLDAFNMKIQSKHKGMYHVKRFSKQTKMQEVRAQLAATMSIENPERIRLFVMNYVGLGSCTSAHMRPVTLSRSLEEDRAPHQPLCLWMSVLNSTEDIELFGEPDPVTVQEHQEVVTTDEVMTQDVENTEAPLAGADHEQDSVQQAVMADIERLPNTTGEQQDPVSRVGEEQDTVMQLGEVPQQTLEENPTIDVPHGHLVDASNHDEMAELSNTHPAVQIDPTEADDAAIAALIAQDAGVMDFTMELDRDGDSVNPQSADNVEAPTTASTQQRPVDSIYGFIQVFDVEKQNFFLHGSFFAKTEETLKECIRRRMGYSSDKEFNLWRRDSMVDGSVVPDDECIMYRRVTNGMDYIVSDIIPKSRVKELEREGKFSDPFHLSKYLRMVDRKHPVRSMTTEQPIEFSEFADDYYLGNLVNGRLHGEKCTWITADGNCYEGPMVCNKKCGKGGKMVYQNGDIYEGEWDNDERHGQGTFIEGRTGNRYVGGFEYGKRWGMGTTYWQVADEQSDLCQICAGEEIDALFFPCGHVCACVECAKQCQICPICRKTVQQVVKMFRA